MRPCFGARTADGSRRRRHPNRRRHRPKEVRMARQDDSETVLRRAETPVASREGPRGSSVSTNGGGHAVEPVYQGGGPAPDSAFERLFHLSARGTNVGTEVRAGL